MDSRRHGLYWARSALQVTRQLEAMRNRIKRSATGSALACPPPPDALPVTVNGRSTRDVAVPHGPAQRLGSSGADSSASSRMCRDRPSTYASRTAPG
jgi:hypothetical protein